MKTKVLTPVWVFSLLVSGMALAGGSPGPSIYDVRQKKSITRQELLVQLDEIDQLVVGEKHFDAFIISTASALMLDWQQRKAQPLTFAWEFLNASNQAQVQAQFTEVKAGRTTATDLIQTVFGPDAEEKVYAPMITAAAFTQGEILAVNLSRAEKAPVVQGGIAALDPALLPEGFEMGGEFYRERFVAAMGGHGDPAKIQNYFEAQCLVDDVIAFHLTHSVSTPLSALLIGDFHSSYRDGVITRLQARDGARKRALIQFARDVSEVSSAQYGDLADFVFIGR